MPYPAIASALLNVCTLCANCTAAEGWPIDCTERIPDCAGRQWSRPRAPPPVVKAAIDDFGTGEMEAAMRKVPSFEILKEVIEQQLNKRQTADPLRVVPSVTISRATGCGALCIALDLSRELEHRFGADRPWSVVDRDLVRRVTQDPHLPRQLARYFQGDAGVDFSRIEGDPRIQNPSAPPVSRDSADTIRRLCGLGGVILMDRSACLMASDLENTLHVRLAGSLEHRVERVARELHMGIQEAQAYVQEADANQAIFVRERLGTSSDSPFHYHLVLNTDRFSDRAAVQTIADCVEQLGRSGGPRAPRSTTRKLRRPE